MDQSIYADPSGLNVLGGLFQMIINDLKNGGAHWEDLIVKASKFHSQLKATIIASTAFLDSFQRIADMATTTRGGTKEIGTSLTRLCLRQRSVEAKLKSFTAALMDCLIIPLQDRVEDWKKTTVALDKEHAKETKRMRHELKKRDPLASSNLTGGGSGYGSSKKHSRMGSKGKYDLMDAINGKGIYATIGATSSLTKSNSLTRSLDCEIADCTDRVAMFEELERNSVRRALVEERSHFCLFVNFMRPVLEEEVAMIGEMSHIQEIMDSLFNLTMDPFDLPESSEASISRLKLAKPKTAGGGNSLNFHTPPSSPSSLGSRKSSMCSISSYNSSSSGGPAALAHNTKHMSLTHIPGNFGLSNYSTSPVFETMGSIMNNHAHDKPSSYSKSAEMQIAFDSNLIATSSTTSGVGKLAPGGRKSNAITLSSTNPFLDGYDLNQDDNNAGSLLSQSNPIATYPFYRSTDVAVTSKTHMSSAQSDSNIASEGSITPTNPEYRSILEGGSASEMHSPLCPAASKTAPAPPVRRTSSISNPNAITIGTLKSAGVGSNHEEIYKNFSLYDEINVLTKSMNDINYTLKHTDFSGSPKERSNGNSNAGTPQRKDSLPPSEQPLISSQQSSMDEASQLPLPAPPPEAFVEANNPVVHYNKIPNINLDFLATLNSKLSQSPLMHQQQQQQQATSSSSSSRRRNSSQSSESNHEKPRSSTRSSSTTRTSRKHFDGMPSSLSQSFRENFLDRLSGSLLAKQSYASPGMMNTSPQQQAELARAAASNALQRKQSVPDLNEIASHRRVTFSSQLDLTSPTQSSSSSAFQVVEIQTNSTQQPIYSSRSQLYSETQDLYGSLTRPVGINMEQQQATSSYESSYQNGGLFQKL